MALSMMKGWRPFDTLFLPGFLCLWGIEYQVDGVVLRPPSQIEMGQADSSRTPLMAGATTRAGDRVASGTGSSSLQQYSDSDREVSGNGDGWTFGLGAAADESINVLSSRPSRPLTSSEMRFLAALQFLGYRGEDQLPADECIICKRDEVLTSGTPGKTAHRRVCVLSCGHTLCLECADAQKEPGVFCPICRKDKLFSDIALSQQIGSRIHRRGGRGRAGAGLSLREGDIDYRVKLGSLLQRRPRGGPENANATAMNVEAAAVGEDVPPSCQEDYLSSGGSRLLWADRQEEDEEFEERSQRQTLGQTTEDDAVGGRGSASFRPGISTEEGVDRAPPAAPDTMDVRGNHGNETRATARAASEADRKAASYLRPERSGSDLGALQRATLTGCHHDKNCRCRKDLCPWQQCYRGGLSMAELDQILGAFPEEGRAARWQAAWNYVEAEQKKYMRIVDEVGHSDPRQHSNSRSSSLSGGGRGAPPPGEATSGPGSPPTSPPAAGGPLPDTPRSDGEDQGSGRTRRQPAGYTCARTTCWGLVDEDRPCTCWRVSPTWVAWMYTEARWSVNVYAPFLFCNQEVGNTLSGPAAIARRRREELGLGEMADEYEMASAPHGEQASPSAAGEPREGARRSGAVQPLSAFMPYKFLHPTPAMHQLWYGPYVDEHMAHRAAEERWSIVNLWLLDQRISADLEAASAARGAHGTSPRDRAFLGRTWAFLASERSARNHRTTLESAVAAQQDFTGRSGSRSMTRFLQFRSVVDLLDAVGAVRVCRVLLRQIRSGNEDLGNGRRREAEQGGPFWTLANTGLDGTSAGHSLHDTDAEGDDHAVEGGGADRDSGAMIIEVQGAESGPQWRTQLERGRLLGREDGAPPPLLAPRSTPEREPSASTPDEHGNAEARSSTSFVARTLSFFDRSPAERRRLCGEVASDCCTQNVVVASQTQPLSCCAVLARTPCSVPVADGCCVLCGRECGSSLLYELGKAHAHGFELPLPIPDALCPSFIPHGKVAIAGKCMENSACFSGLHGVNLVQLPLSPCCCWVACIGVYGCASYSCVARPAATGEPGERFRAVANGRGDAVGVLDSHQTCCCIHSKAPGHLFCGEVERDFLLHPYNRMLREAVLLGKGCCNVRPDSDSDVGGVVPGEGDANESGVRFVELRSDGRQDINGSGRGGGSNEASRVRNRRASSSARSSFVPPPQTLFPSSSSGLARAPALMVMRGDGRDGDMLGGVAEEDENCLAAEDDQGDECAELTRLFSELQIDSDHDRRTESWFRDLRHATGIARGPSRNSDTNWSKASTATTLNDHESSTSITPAARREMTDVLRLLRILQRGAAGGRASGERPENVLIEEIADTFLPPGASAAQHLLEKKELVGNPAAKDLLWTLHLALKHRDTIT